MRTPVIDGRSIEQFIPANLRGMFYRNPIPQYRYAIHDGYDPYGFSTDGLVLYLPLWALNNGGTNSIQSVDAYKTTCDITGALWRPNGRELDGVDDNIQLTSYFGDINFKNQAITVDAWVKSTDALAQTVVAIKPAGSRFGFHVMSLNGRIWVHFLRSDAVSTGRVGQITPDTSSINVFHHYFVSYDGSGAPDGTNIIALIDGVQQTLTESLSSYLWHATDNTIRVGLTPEAKLKGLIGEVRVHSRQQSIPEGQRVYQATKWRYQ